MRSTIERKKHQRESDNHDDNTPSQSHNKNENGESDIGECDKRKREDGDAKLERANKKRRNEGVADMDRDEVITIDSIETRPAQTLTGIETSVEMRFLVEKERQDGRSDLNDQVFPPCPFTGNTSLLPRGSRVLLPLSLQVQGSLFDHIVLKEPVDIQLLDQLIERNRTRSPCEWLLPRYKELIVSGKANVEHTKPQFGRAVVKGSLGMHNMERRSRHTLARHNFTDWDMKNAHPTILLQICETHNIACEELQYYVKNREACLVDVMKEYDVRRDKAKDLFLRMMFLGSFTAWAKDHGLHQCVVMPRLASFSQELSRIAKIIKDRNSGVADYVLTTDKAKKKHFNFEASVLSTFLQEVECRLLETLIRHCLEKSLIQDNVAVLCNDGFMLETRLSRPELALDFNRLILEKHGFDLEFVAKPMDEFILLASTNQEPGDKSTSHTITTLLTLTPRRSCLDGITLNEPFNYIKVKRLLNSTIQFDSILSESEDATYQDATQVPPKNSFAKNCRGKLMDYIQLPIMAISKREYAQVQYQRGLYGRCFPKRSGVQNMNRKIRHHLVGEELVDIDTVNSGASLLYNILRLNPTKFGPLSNFPAIVRYVTHRKEVLEEVMIRCNVDKEKAKTLFISVMNGGGLPSWPNLPVCVKKYKKEIETMTEIIVKANPDLVDFVRNRKLEKNKSLSNLNASVMANYIFDLEQLVNETIYLYLKEGGYLVNNVCVLANDGIMIPIERYHDDLLQELKEEVLEKLGFDLEFVVKPMAQGVTEEEVTANQSVPLSEEEILSTRPTPTPTVKPRSLPSWVPAQEEMYSLINNHPFFAGSMSVTRKGDENTYFMQNVIGPIAWKCPIRTDCERRAGGFTRITEHGLRYYCQGLWRQMVTAIILKG
jgi:hypothetical protein